MTLSSCVGRPKSEDSRRVLGLGELVERYGVKAEADGAGPNDFVFQQKRAPGKPLWDSGVRDALHLHADQHRTGNHGRRLRHPRFVARRPARLSPVKDVTAHLTDYAGYHRDKRNIATLRSLIGAPAAG